MDKFYFRQQIMPSLDQVRSVRESLTELFPKLQISDERVNELLLGISELLVNTIQHGTPSPTKIEITLKQETTEQRWWMEIFDDGGAFDPGLMESAVFDLAVFDSAKNSEKMESISNRYSDTDSNSSCYTTSEEFEDPGELAFNLDAESGRGLMLIQQLFPGSTYEPADARRSSRNCFKIDLGAIQSAKPRVLIVDDDPSMLKLLGFYLQDEYWLHCYSNAEEALAFLRENKVDLLVSDIKMQQMSGLEFRKQLLSFPEIQSIPFIFITGQADERLLDQAADLAIDDYLEKPVSKHQLRRVLTRVLKRSRQLVEQQGDRFDTHLTNMLLPALPIKLCDFSVCVEYRVASAGGGDLVFHQVNSDSTVLILADLMGHGTQAKFYAHALAGYLRGLLSYSLSLPGPAEILSQLSRTMYRDPLLSTTLMTCLIVEIRSGHRIRIANGGHPLPMLQHDGVWSEISVEGELPGLNSSTVFEEIELKLNPNDKLLMCTDGLWEQGATVSQRHLHEQTMRNAISLADCSDDQVEERLVVEDRLANVAQRIIRAFDHSAGTEPEDDVSLILLQAD